MESKVRSAAEVLTRCFGATFFLEVEVEGAGTSTVRGLCLSDWSRNITYGWCEPAMDQVRFLGNHQDYVLQHLPVSESG